MKAFIDWVNVAEAIEAYRTVGYQYIEAPWVVSEEAMNVTLPPGHTAQRCSDGPLVGSAEQSFIHMMLEGDLKPGKYVAATPCFRDDQVDEWHRRMFFKVELIEFALSPFPDLAARIDRMVKEAADFFWVCGAEEIEKVKTPAGFDIELNGVELGSYGYRSYKNFHWIYGTGYADPRFTQALNTALG